MVADSIITGAIAVLHSYFLYTFQYTDILMYCSTLSTKNFGVKYFWRNSEINSHRKFLAPKFFIPNTITLKFIENDKFHRNCFHRIFLHQNICHRNFSYLMYMLIYS